MDYKTKRDIAFTLYLGIGLAVVGGLMLIILGLFSQRSEIEKDYISLWDSINWSMVSIGIFLLISARVGWLIVRSWLRTEKQLEMMRLERIQMNQDSIKRRKKNSKLMRKSQIDSKQIESYQSQSNLNPNNPLSETNKSKKQKDKNIEKELELK